MSLTLNYIVVVISACTHPCDIQTPLPTTSQENIATKNP